MQTRNIMIVGVGGQGTLIASRILGGIATTAGLDVKVSEVHGMAQRGGSVVTFVRYGDEVFEPIVEEGCADVLIAFERLEAKRYAHFLKPDGVLIVNDVRIDPMPVRIGAATENIFSTIAVRLDTEKPPWIKRNRVAYIIANATPAMIKVRLVLSLLNMRTPLGDMGIPKWEIS